MGDDGTYSIRGKPDKILARNLVFGDAYYQSKFIMMDKINRFYELIDLRTGKEVRDVEKMLTVYQAIALVLSIVIIGMSVIGFVTSRRDVIRPIVILSEWVERMHRGEYVFEAWQFRPDEIGRIANTFAAMAAQVASNLSDLERVSQTDALTQIKNRGALDRALVNEMARFERYGTPCAILMIDTDHFKRVNDQCGHAVGDMVLREVANVVIDAIRASDIPGRWGGEEFLVICPNTDVEAALRVAERVRERVDHREFGGAGHITVSIGVSAFEKGVSVEGTVRNADELLYRAKSEGRNRVCCGVVTDETRLRMDRQEGDA